VKTKGVLLCGGEGTRLRPLTKAVNKHMIRIGNKLMLDYPISKFIDAGLRDIHVVIGGEHFDAIVKYLGSGFDRGVRFTYSMQDRAGGIAEAIGLAEQFADGHKIVVILGDNIFEASIFPEVADFIDSKCKTEARLFYTHSDTPEKFGCLVYGDVGGPVDIVEKPKAPPSNDIVTGIYMYTPDVFEVIKTLKPSNRGELEVTDLSRYYMLNDTSECVIHELKGWWSDCGSLESIAKAEVLVRASNL
jgi:glucose-1-phosphate thymidylyltransferase